MANTEEIYRPGLEGVVAGETAISTIAGGLQYRGYSIETLADKSSFEEVVYLLLNGQLPKQSDLDTFRSRIGAASELPEELLEFLRTIPHSASMMDIMRSGASLLSHWDPDADDNSPEANMRKSERLLAQLPIVMGARHRLRLGEFPVTPKPDHSIAFNILRMVNGKDPSERLERAMDVSLILYAEHEFNASTFTARVICSTLSDMHSSIAGAIGALKGPLHGGANERVMEVLEQVGSPEKAGSWVREQLDQKKRIMGFGHRVYKDGDPRAQYLKSLCGELAVESGKQSLEQTAAIIEDVVVSEKKLPPNLDWPSARLYHYMGLPVDLYTPLFVCSRTSGWAAHVMEQLANNRLIRPRARYTGELECQWVPISQR